MFVSSLSSLTAGEDDSIIGLRTRDHKLKEESFSSDALADGKCECDLRRLCPFTIGHVKSLGMTCKMINTL
jgi:hypothetical protein